MFFLFILTATILLYAVKYRRFNSSGYETFVWTAVSVGFYEGAVYFLPALAQQKFVIGVFFEAILIYTGLELVILYSNHAHRQNGLTGLAYKTFGFLYVSGVTILALIPTILFPFFIDLPKEKPIVDHKIIEFWRGNHQVLENLVADAPGDEHLYAFGGLYTLREQNPPAQLKRLVESHQNLNITRVFLSTSGLIMEFGRGSYWLEATHQKSLIYLPLGTPKDLVNQYIYDETNSYVAAHLSTISANGGMSFGRSIDPQWLISHNVTTK